MSIGVGLAVVLACGGGDSGKEGIFFLENLVYVSKFNGPQELYLRRSPNGEISQVTRNAFNDFDPALSRDGTRVAFASDRSGDIEIFNSKLDGSNALKLTNTPGRDHSPTWSPNGKVILFVREVGGVNLLMRMNADGTNQSMLIPDEGTEPCYNRSGTKIAFISERTGNKEVWTCDPNGANQVQLTFTTGAESNPSWNPTGAEICYAYDNGVDPAIYRMNADGTNARVFIDTPGKVDAGPLWGADGRFVAFSTESFVGAQDGQIVVAEVDGKGRDQITSGSGGNVQPAIK